MDWNMFELICGVFLSACCSNSLPVLRRTRQVGVRFSQFFSMCCKLQGKSVYREKKEHQMFPIWVQKLLQIVTSLSLQRTECLKSFLVILKFPVVVVAQKVQNMSYIQLGGQKTWNETSSRFSLISAGLWGWPRDTGAWDDWRLSHHPDGNIFILGPTKLNLLLH